MSNIATTTVTTEESKNDEIPKLKIIDSSLRLSVIPLCIATICLSVTNHQKDIIYGDLHFINFTALKYLVTVSAICACYALVAVSCSWARLFVAKAWIFFVSDQAKEWVMLCGVKLFYTSGLILFVCRKNSSCKVIAYLMVSSGAAVMETLYIASNGDQEVSWSEACLAYGSFCNKLKIALIVHALALCCFLVLAVISAFRAFSQFDPPFIPSQEGCQEAKKVGDQESKC